MCWCKVYRFWSVSLQSLDVARCARKFPTKMICDNKLLLLGMPLIRYHFSFPPLFTSFPKNRMTHDKGHKLLEIYRGMGSQIRSLRREVVSRSAGLGVFLLFRPMTSWKLPAEVLSLFDPFAAAVSGGFSGLVQTGGF